MRRVEGAMTVMLYENDDPLSGFPSFLSRKTWKWSCLEGNIRNSVLTIGEDKRLDHGVDARLA